MYDNQSRVAPASIRAARWRCAVGAGLALLGSMVAVAAPLDDFTVSEVAPGNWVHVGSLDERTVDNLGDQANIGFIVGERCVAVVDPGGSLLVGQALRAAIRRVTDRPVCYVIYTHLHPDHLFGAAAFQPDGATFVGHEKLPRALAVRGASYVNSLKRDLGAAAAGSELVVPTQLVRGELRLDLGGRTLLLKAWPVAHTDDDLTVLDESTGTLWLGDLLFCEHTPVLDGSIRGFLKVMDQLAALPAGQFVPGHGRTGLRWPEALNPQRSYLQMIARDVRAAIRNNQTIEQAVESVGQSARNDWTNFDRFHGRNVTTAYAELEWSDDE
ncbi:MAG: quinoprotein relay system zinc metallohydrolase 2 [Burkholderiales bacterium]|nr:quinoprotein relay system zinc metallohydrolase 2 [Burkholderiales bacterium]